MTSFKSSRAPRYGGAFASVGSTVGKHAVIWRTRTCAQCGAVPQELCFRWITEKVTEGIGTFEGGGRKSYLKHPHPVRKANHNG